jgi:hypothetical protein
MKLALYREPTNKLGSPAAGLKIGSVQLQTTQLQLNYNYIKVVDQSDYDT